MKLRSLFISVFLSFEFFATSSFGGSIFLESPKDGLYYSEKIIRGEVGRFYEDEKENLSKRSHPKHERIWFIELLLRHGEKIKLMYPSYDQDKDLIEYNGSNLEREMERILKEGIDITRCINQNNYNGEAKVWSNYNSHARKWFSPLVIWGVRVLTMNGCETDPTGLSVHLMDNPRFKDAIPMNLGLVINVDPWDWRTLTADTMKCLPSMEADVRVPFELSNGETIIFNRAILKSCIRWKIVSQKKDPLPPYQIQSDEIEILGEKGYLTLIHDSDAPSFPSRLLYSSKYSAVPEIAKTENFAKTVCEALGFSIVVMDDEKKTLKCKKQPWFSTPPQN